MKYAIGTVLVFFPQIIETLSQLHKQARQSNDAIKTIGCHVLVFYGLKYRHLSEFSNTVCVCVYVKFHNWLYFLRSYFAISASFRLIYSPLIHVSFHRCKRDLIQRRKTILFPFLEYTVHNWKVSLPGPFYRVSCHAFLQLTFSLRGALTENRPLCVRRNSHVGHWDTKNRSQFASARNNSKLHLCRVKLDAS